MMNLHDGSLFQLYSSCCYSHVPQAEEIQVAATRVGLDVAVAPAAFEL
jgi:hypothetical protein